MSFKICHIGCGSMSLRGHGPAMKKYSMDYPGTSLAGCCDLEWGKAVEFKNEFGFTKAYIDWKKMLEIEKPDAVCLVVPVMSTTGLAVGILSTGYNLLMEKPPGITAEECTLIINTIKRTGVKAAAAFNRRHIPIVKKLMKILFESNIKQPHIKYDFYRTGRKDADFSTTAIHAIDTVKMIAGCRYSDLKIDYQPLNNTPVCNIFINGNMENGSTISINFYPDSGITAERAVVISGGNTFFLNIPIWDCPDYPGKISHYRNGKEIDEITGEQDKMFISSGFYDEHRDFYNAVRNNRPVGFEIEDSLQSVEIMEVLRKGNPVFSLDK